MKIFVLSTLLFFFFLLPVYGQGVTQPTNDPTSQPKVSAYSSNKEAKRGVSNRFAKFRAACHTDFVTKYIWNGINNSRGPTWQPSLNVEYGPFGGSVWTNFVLGEEPNQGQFNEVDITAYYQRKIHRLEIDFSLTLSVYPNGNPASLNFSPTQFQGNLYLTHPVGPINLMTTLYFGMVNPGGGILWKMGLGYQKKLPLNFSVTTYAQWGLSNGPYNSFYLAPAGFVPSFFEFSLGFPWSPKHGLILRPQMNISTLLNGTLRSSTSNPTNIIGVFYLSYNI